MLAYKGFNKDLQATLGNGVFQFKPGKTYEEKECKCARNGFHCAENPLCALGYYRSMDARFFIVRAEGDINQDGTGSRISSTKMTLVKEIDRIRLAAHACLYMQKYPQRDHESEYVKEEEGRCGRKGDFIIVRGKSPKAAGVRESYLFLVKEAENSREIEEICTVFIDGTEFRENIWYGLEGGEICEKKNCEK